METNDRRAGTDRRSKFLTLKFLERRALGKERREHTHDLWGEPLPPWQAEAPAPHKRPYPAEV